jgi:ubiquinone biosynthesis protein COQ9
MTNASPSTALLPDDPTLAEVRAALIDSVADNAAFDGWTDLAVVTAAQLHGVDSDIARLAFAGGAAAMIDMWFGTIDAAMTAALPPETLAPMKITARISALIETRLTLLAPRRDSLRRAQAVLVQPQNVARAARLGWRAADVMWRLAGDTATDLNHYTKRMTLGAVYAATLSVFVDDDSADWAETRAFLARRLAGVGRFEKWKAGRRAAAERRPSLTRFVSRLRYPAR